MRPRIDAETELRNRIREYAKSNGLTTARAWALAAETGIEELEEVEDG